MNGSVLTEESVDKNSLRDAALVWLRLASEKTFDEWFQDVDSETYKELESFLPKYLIVYRNFLKDQLRAAWKLARECVNKAYESLPKLNKHIESISQVGRNEWERYVQNMKVAEEQEFLLKDHRECAINELQLAERNYAQAKTKLDVLREPIDRIEKAKWSLAATELSRVSWKDELVEWLIRAMIALALGLSLGLLIGALNPYKPFSRELAVFWLVGLSILITAGETVKRLSLQAGEAAELRFFPDAVERGHKWLWFIFAFLVFMSIADAVVLAFGAFRLAVVASAEGGPGVPNWVLFLGCFIFAFPYLCMEAGYGWCVGASRVRELAKSALADAEQSVEELTLEKLADEAANVARYEKDLEYAKRRLDEIDTKINHIRSSVPEPVVVFPVKGDIPGVYVTSRSGRKQVIELLPLEDLPASEELKNALQQFVLALDKLRAWDSEIERLVREISTRALQGDRIYPLGQKHRPSFFGKLLRGGGLS
ncbi:MAG: hypothetical protein ACUVRS_03305 [Armatimonadota bacterium]